MELSALPFRSGGNLPCKNGGEGIIKLCGKIKRFLDGVESFNSNERRNNIMLILQ